MPWLKVKPAPVDKSVETVDNSNCRKVKNAILGIYAKQPLPGQVKTRLCPPLSKSEATELYRHSLQETITRMQGNHFELVICYAGDQQWFEKAFPGVKLMAQQGADLGARMSNSLKCLFELGYQQTLLIGSDTPDLPLPLIEQAFEKLQQVDVVVAPAADGGYVLIGESVHHPELFTKIHWSTDNVLPETLRRITQLGITAEQLSEWDDLDDLAALQRFLHRSPKSTTAHYLQQQLAHYF